MLLGWEREGDLVSDVDELLSRLRDVFTRA